MPGTSNGPSVPGLPHSSAATTAQDRAIAAPVPASINLVCSAIGRQRKRQAITSPITTNPSPPRMNMPGTSTFTRQSPT